MEATAVKDAKELVQAAWNKRPLIISGPCSAETETQVIETATRLAATGKVDMLRAGIWKPRTRPGSFEGIGTKDCPGCNRPGNSAACPSP
jgi:3-deoxy-D-arabino-heptulosonate 7-phosphate (DAHP) synthase